MFMLLHTHYFLGTNQSNRLVRTTLLALNVWRVEAWKQRLNPRSVQYVRNLITHTIPEEAIKRFINSKECYCNGDNVVQRYLNSLSPKTIARNSRGILRFCWIVHKTPRQLVEMGYNKMGLRDVSEIEKMLDDSETYCLARAGRFDMSI